MERDVEKTDTLNSYELHFIKHVLIEHIDILKCVCGMDEKYKKELLKCVDSVIHKIETIERIEP